MVKAAQRRHAADPVQGRLALGQTDYEANLIHDVKAGRRISAAGTRAFDDVMGLSLFDALNAPLLIDCLALERKVLESPLAP